MNKNWTFTKVTYACHPSYSGGRDQEDLIQSQPRQIVCETLSQKKSQKRAGGVAHGIGPEFKPQYTKTTLYVWACASHCLGDQDGSCLTLAMTKVDCLYQKEKII
jgi:hypothetical protein